jgi:integrase
MALHTGMRKGEILGLRWRNVNWERKTVLPTDTKNGESRRLPIDSKLLHELSEHRTRVKSEELVFPSYDRNGKVVPLNDVKGSFVLARTDAGIASFRFHDLRHTFASHYVVSGGQLYTLSKILGHKDEDNATLRKAFFAIHRRGKGSNGHYLDTGTKCRLHNFCSSSH